MHDGVHHKHVQRHQNERYRIPTRNLHGLRAINQTENAHQQNRRPQRDYTRMGMDPDQILAKKALAQPHRIFISSPDKEQIEIQKLRYVLKESIIRELQSADPKNGINSHLADGSPGEIRTLVRGSKALYACPLHHRASYPLYVQLS